MRQNGIVRHCGLFDRGRIGISSKEARFFALMKGVAMTTVGIVSDTHGRLPLRAYEALAVSDVIIHAGDICDPRILRDLESLARVYAVLGNNDFDEYGTGVCRFASPVVDGVRFLVAHYPHQVSIGPHGCVALAPGDPLPEVCVHGHTHIPRMTIGKDARPASLVLCPGSPSRPRGGFPASVAFLEVEEGRILQARIESLEGEVLMEERFR